MQQAHPEPPRAGLVIDTDGGRRAASSRRHALLAVDHRDPGGRHFQFNNQLNFNVAGASLLHYGTSFGGALWFADVGANVSGAGGGIFKVTLDGIGNPLTSARVASVDGAISVSFSPDGDEMFVASHFAGTLTGYAVTGGIVAGSANLFIDGGVLPSWGGAHVQYGGMAVAAAVPEPATWALGLAGAAALCAWRRRRA